LRLIPIKQTLGSLSLLRGDENRGCPIGLCESMTGRDMRSPALSHHESSTMRACALAQTIATSVTLV